MMQFNRPLTRNAFSALMMEEFQHLLTDIDKNLEIKVLVLRGSGRAFCSGLDLRSVNGI